MVTVNIYQDNVLKQTFEHKQNDFCALRWLLNNQSQSTDYALKYGGYKVELIDEQTGEKDYWKSYSK